MHGGLRICMNRVLLALADSIDFYGLSNAARHCTVQFRSYKISAKSVASGEFVREPLRMDVEISNKVLCSRLLPEAVH